MNGNKYWLEDFMKRDSLGDGFDRREDSMK
jgi:hypothetical protein